MAKEGAGWSQEWTPVFPSKVGQRTWLLMGSKSPAGGCVWGSYGLLVGFWGGRSYWIKLHMSLASLGHTARWSGGCAMAEKPLETPIDG